GPTVALGTSRCAAQAAKSTVAVADRSGTRSLLALPSRLCVSATVSAFLSASTLWAPVIEAAVLLAFMAPPRWKRLCGSAAPVGQCATAALCTPRRARARAGPLLGRNRRSAPLRSPTHD